MEINRIAISKFSPAYFLLLILPSLLSGCSGYMMNTVSAIGHRTESFDQYKTFEVKDDVLIVGLTTNIRATDPSPCNHSFYTESNIARKENRWGIIDLSSKWNVPDFNKGASWWSSDNISLIPSENQFPKNGNASLALKPKKKDWYHQAYRKFPINIEQTIKTQIQECMVDSTYCINYPYGHQSSEFVLLKREGQSEEVFLKTIKTWDNDYYEPWSRVVHFSLMPFAIIFDVIAFPLSLTRFACM